MMTFPETSTNETKVDGSPVPAQVQTPEPTQPSYITAEQFEKTINEIKADYQQKYDQLYRGTQSRQDQFTAKVQKKLEAFEGAAKATGVQLTDTDRQVAKANAQFQVLSEETPTAQSSGNVPGQVQPQGNADDGLAALVNDAATKMMQVWGISIDEKDPENALITAAEEGTPQGYLDATYKAIQTKLARTKTSQVAQPAPTTGIPKSPGIVQGVPISNPIENITDPNELWKMTKLAKG
jgi:predicted amidohydrolase YtcJ